MNALVSIFICCWLVGCCLSASGAGVLTKAVSAHEVKYRTINRKTYALKDHLKNVRVTIPDYKEPQTISTSIPPSDFYLDLRSVLDYYPFGSLMPDRNYNDPDYRYGYGSMEKDDELKSKSGTSYDFGARFYDPRCGRWMSLDPLAAKYPGLSPYHHSADNPILFSDRDGQEFKLMNSDEALAYLLNGGRAISPDERAALNFTPDLRIMNQYTAGRVGRVNRFLQNARGAINSVSPTMGSFIQNNELQIYFSEIPVEERLGTRPMGIFNPSDKTIHIRGDLDGSIFLFDGTNIRTESDLVITVLHEVIHAMGYGEGHAYAVELYLNYSVENIGRSGSLIEPLVLDQAQFSPHFGNKATDINTFLNGFVNNVIDGVKYYELGLPQHIRDLMARPDFQMALMKRGQEDQLTDEERKAIENFHKAMLELGRDVLNGTAPVPANPDE